MRKFIQSTSFVCSLLLIPNIAANAQSVDPREAARIQREKDQIANCIATYRPNAGQDHSGAAGNCQYLFFNYTKDDEATDKSLEKLSKAVNDSVGNAGQWGGNRANAKETINLLFGEMNDHRGKWLSARNSWSQTSQSLDKLERQILVLYTNFMPAGTKVLLKFNDKLICKKHTQIALEMQAIIDAKCKSRSTSNTAAIENATTAKKEYFGYINRRAVLKERTAHYAASITAAPIQLAQNTAAGLRKAGEGEPLKCSIDTDLERRTLQPSDCNSPVGSLVDGNNPLAIPLPKRPPLYSDYMPIPSGPITPNGLTTRYTIGKGGDALTLKYTRDYKLRTLYTPGKKFQKQSRWGWSVGLESSSDENRVINLGERKDDPFHQPLDRLDSKTTASVGLFYKSFDAETGESFDRRGRLMREAAVKACLEDQVKDGSVASSCEGRQLVKWVVQREKNEYLHPTNAKSLNELYYGVPAELGLPRWGAGAELTLGFPSYYYVNEVVGQAIDVYKLADGNRERKTAYSIKPFVFTRLTKNNSAVDASLFGALAYSEARKFVDEKRVTKLCKDAEKKDCENAVIGAPIKVSSWDPSVEMRIHFKRPGFGVPQFGLAPKALHSDSKDRWEFEMPLYFVTDIDKKLNAGVSFKHRTKGIDEVTQKTLDKESGLYLFLGTTFNLDGL